jgi:hypothetical protein
MKIGLPNIVAIANWLSAQLQSNPEVIADLKRDCEEALKPFLVESAKRANVAKAVMQENRFWFGKELYDHCSDFHAALHKVCVSFEKKDFAALPEQLKVLKKRRQNVLTVLQTVRSLPPEPVNDANANQPD